MDRGHDHTAYVFFWRKDSPFSQWHPSTYTLDNVTFSCCEQGMMYEKAKLFDPAQCPKILQTKSPKEMKALGRQVRNFNDKIWKNKREEIVYQHNVAKFSQNAHLLEKLLSCGNKTFVEASPSDAIWGIGMGEQEAKFLPPSQWKGLNLLGKAITRARDTIVANQTGVGTSKEPIMVDEEELSPEEIERIAKFYARIEQIDDTDELIAACASFSELFAAILRNPQDKGFTHLSAQHSGLFGIPGAVGFLEACGFCLQTGTETWALTPSPKSLQKIREAKKTVEFLL